MIWQFRAELYSIAFKEAIEIKIKPIKNFEDYSITSSGKVISFKHKTPREMKTWFQKSGYENIKLCSNGSCHHKLIHRLVAEAFIENPMNLPEVNHKDRDPKNNSLENLEWCSRKENLEHSEMGFTRNTHRCAVINSENEVVKIFETISSASDWCHSEFGCSKTYIQKGGISKGYRIEKV